MIKKMFRAQQFWGDKQKNVLSSLLYLILQQTSTTKVMKQDHSIRFVSKAIVMTRT